MKWLQWSIQQLISDAFICLLTADSSLLIVFPRQVSPLQTKRSNLRTLYNPTLPGGGGAPPGSDCSWALRSDLLFETFSRLSASSICKCSTVSASRLGVGPVTLAHTLLANPPLPLPVMVKITRLWNLTDCTFYFSPFFACHLHSPSLFIYSRALSGRRSRLMMLATPAGLLRQVAELCLRAIKKAGLSGSV